MLSLIESGRRNVTVDVVQRVMAALGPETAAAPHQAIVDRFARIAPRLTESQLGAFVAMLSLLEQQLDQDPSNSR